MIEVKVIKYQQKSSIPMWDQNLASIEEKG